MKTINHFCEQLLELFLDEKLKQLYANRYKISSEEWGRIVIAVNEYLSQVERTFTILKEKEDLMIISPEEKIELENISGKSISLFNKLDKILIQNCNNSLDKSMSEYYYDKNICENENVHAREICTILKTDYEKMIRHWLLHSEN